MTITHKRAWGLLALLAIIGLVSAARIYYYTNVKSAQVLRLVCSPGHAGPLIICIKSGTQVEWADDDVRVIRFFQNATACVPTTRAATNYGTLELQDDRGLKMLVDTQGMRPKEVALRSLGMFGSDDVVVYFVGTGVEADEFIRTFRVGPDLCSCE